MRESRVGLLHKKNKSVYALHFIVLVSRHRARQKQSKCELGNWERIGLKFSVRFHLLCVMFWKDNLPLLGNQPPYIAISSCLGHPSASSDSFLVSSLCFSQRWVLRLQWKSQTSPRASRSPTAPICPALFCSLGQHSALSETSKLVHSTNG